MKLIKKALKFTEEGEVEIRPSTEGLEQWAGADLRRPARSPLGSSPIDFKAAV
jgi:hypothetical protein